MPSELITGYRIYFFKSFILPDQGRMRIRFRTDTSLRSAWENNNTFSLLQGGVLEGGGGGM